MSELTENYLDFVKADRMFFLDEFMKVVRMIFKQKAQLEHLLVIKDFSQSEYSMSYLTMLGWSKDLRMEIYLRAEPGIPSSLVLILIFLIAISLPVSLSLAIATIPKDPSPILLRNSKRRPSYPWSSLGD